jgi:hypothetical protein
LLDGPPLLEWLLSLLAEIMTGEEPFTEPSRYAASRFRNGATTQGAYS